MTSAPQHIFVLGLQRSGTTWVANLLAAHSQIAAVEAARHHGVHESIFFSHFARMFGPWSDPASKASALDVFLQSDYFALSGVETADARTLAKKTEGASDFFAAFMDRVASDRGAVAWVEKSPHHSLLAETLAAALPTARFLCVTRHSRTLVRSRLWSYGRQPARYPLRAQHILRACASNTFHSRYLRRFVQEVGPERAQLLTFEELKAQGPAALNPFLEVCGLEPMGQTESQYVRNSSFASQDARRAALSRLDEALVAMCELMMTVVPLPLLCALQNSLARRRPVRFPDWVWAESAAKTRTQQNNARPVQ